MPSSCAPRRRSEVPVHTIAFHIISQAETRRAAELERNNGVLYHAELASIPLDPATATSRGIKRAADKVSLPRSVESVLMTQQAYKNGALTFEVAHPNGRRTHVGVLDFASAEGTVQLPEEVVRCLWGPDSTADDCSGLVTVRYSRLPKGYEESSQHHLNTSQHISTPMS